MIDIDTFVISWFPLWLAQVLRGACILIGPFCILLSGYHFHHMALSHQQRYRFAALSLLLISAVYTQMERWSDPVTPRLFVATAGVTFAFLGLWGLQKEDPSDSSLRK